MPSKRIAYITSRFPKLTETFVLYEILELERLGMAVEVFALVHEREAVVHAEAQAVAERAQYGEQGGLGLLAAQVYWLARRPAAYLRAWASAIGGNLRSPKFLLRALAVVPQAAWFARSMQQRGVEHVHAHWATHPALAAFVVRMLAGIPYSFTAHAHDIYVERPMLAEKLRGASFVVTISEYNRRLLAELYGALADRVHVIHCGVDAAVFQPRPERPQGDIATLLCVASLQEYKGHSYLLEACARMHAAGQRFRCLLVGEGEQRAALEAQIVRLGLAEHVELLGHQPRSRVSALMGEADIVVLPSVTTASGKREGIPVALMEAMACALPVVATAISGVPELVLHDQTGLLVPERDAASLAEALLLLCRDAELGRRLGLAGRDHVLRHFDLKQNAGRLHTLLERDLESGQVCAEETSPEGDHGARAPDRSDGYHESLRVIEQASGGRR
jgi:colanic acid/amylovoran biosynthesis glycosyltransferase